MKAFSMEYMSAQFQGQDFSLFVELFKADFANEVSNFLLLFHLPGLKTSLLLFLSKLLREFKACFLIFSFLDLFLLLIC
jgi:hypothetical protein